MDRIIIAKRLMRIAEDVMEGFPTEADVVEYLLENPSPSDDQFHEWAEERGFDKHKTEEVAYRLAARYAQFFMGGRSREKELRLEDVDANELVAGIEVEFEHSSDRTTAKKIALDHLAEFPDSPLGYYTALLLMEKIIESLQEASKEESDRKIQKLKELAE